MRMGEADIAVQLFASFAAAAMDENENDEEDGSELGEVKHDEDDNHHDNQNLSVDSTTIEITKIEQVSEFVCVRWFFF